MKIFLKILLTSLITLIVIAMWIILLSVKNVNILMLITVSAISITITTIFAIATKLMWKDK